MAIAGPVTIIVIVALVVLGVLGYLLDSSADWHVHELTRVDDALTRITQGKIRCLPRFATNRSLPFYYPLTLALHEH